MNATDQAAVTTESEAISFADFLESVPPSQMKPVSALADKKASPGGGGYHELRVPQLQLFCTHDTCSGLRYFRYTEGDRAIRGGSEATYLTYQCSNCRKVTKMFSLHVAITEGTQGKAYKFGELPAFGVPTPPRMLRMFGDDRDLFLKGRRCESQGLGIGAFGYYRRVVESHKNQILDEVLRVAEKVGAPEEMIASLRSAKSEIQFSKAMTSVKNAIPQSLLINGQNPLTLLHSALSVGLHDETDDRCLELAHDIRVVLAELAERIGSALKDEDELNTAVSRLMNARSPKPKATSS